MPTASIDLLRWGWRVLTMRKGIAVGITFLFVIAAAVIYSVGFKQWCLQHQRGWGGGKTAWGENFYGEDLGKCIRKKDWLSF